MFLKIFNKKNIKFFLGLIIIAGVFFVFLYQSKKETIFIGKSFSFPNSTKEETLEEASSAKNSKNNFWWLSSGGIMEIKNQEFSTNLGKLSKKSKWQKLYKKNNSRDTDEGYRPQNVFRLVTKSEWKNYSQSVYFYIKSTNVSESSYYNESNGILFFNRYQDGDNLYYTGIRVDGKVVIKKKINGKYYTLAQKEALKIIEEYNKIDNSNLIPQKKWIGLKTEFVNSWNDSVVIRIYLDLENNGNWKQVLKAKDIDNKYGEKPFLKEGHAGIRTDFMDVRFRDYQITEKE